MALIFVGQATGAISKFRRGDGRNEAEKRDMMTQLPPVELPDSITDLRFFVSQSIPVSENHYPNLMQDSSVTAFCVRHSALHFSKTSGQLAALAEMMDHGHQADIHAATKIVANSLVNALKLAEELNISTDKILEYLVGKYSS